jgi:hypothetical protein
MVTAQSVAAMVQPVTTPNHHRLSLHKPNPDHVRPKALADNARIVHADHARGIGRNQADALMQRPPVLRLRIDGASVRLMGA